MTEIPSIELLTEVLCCIKESLNRLPLNGCACVYALYDTGAPDVIRYIGYTNVGAASRLKEHLKCARRKGKRGCDSLVYEWIRSVTAAGRSVRTRVLCCGMSQSLGLMVEEDLINEFRTKYPLLNW
jgi:hypothetical protein